jgi:hypothetical protein
LGDSVFAANFKYSAAFARYCSELNILYLLQ